MLRRYCKGRWKVLLGWLGMISILYAWISSNKTVLNTPTDVDVHSNITGQASKWKTMTKILAQLAGQYPAPDDRPMVLLLSYQRCGSSFLGQLFNHHPDAFYVFEPGDSVYMAMYGTGAGWNVPSDITHYWNGRKRTIPDHEKITFADTIANLLLCNMDKVSSEFYLHTFWYKFPDSLGRLFPFKKCMSSKKLTTDSCRKPHIGDMCPERFGADIQAHEQCRRRMKDTYQEMIDNSSSESSDNHNFEYNVFRDYYFCLNNARHQIMDCVKNMEYVCTKSRLASVKTVRATMDTVEELLKVIPNLKVLHLIRDPRAVVRSRMTRPSFRGHHSGKDMVKEAKLYCEDVASDIQKRQKLEQKYPGSFMEIIYEAFTSEPLKGAEKVYDFLQVELPWEVSEWVHRYTSEKKNASRIAEKWQDTVPYRTTLNINKNCQQLFNAVNYAWP